MSCEASHELLLALGDVSKVVRSMVDQRGLAALRAESTRGFGAGEEDLDGKLKFSSYTGLPIPISCRSRADNSLASKTPMLQESLFRQDEPDTRFKGHPRGTGKLKIRALKLDRYKLRPYAGNMRGHGKLAAIVQCAAEQTKP